MMRGRHAGFTLVELLTTVTVAGVLAAVSIPPISGAMRRYSLNTTSRIIAAEIRAARFKAVAANRTMRVQFNCPGPDQFRVVEVVGDPAIDDDKDRCSETAYPYPDRSPATRPNADGRVVSLNGVTFGAVTHLQISPRGRVQPMSGCPDNCRVISGSQAAINFTNGHETERIGVSLSGVIGR